MKINDAGQPDLVAIKEELNFVNTCQQMYAPVIWGFKWRCF
jgi:hypothetical protein